MPTYKVYYTIEGLVEVEAEDRSEAKEKAIDRADPNANETASASETFKISN